MNGNRVFDFWDVPLVMPLSVDGSHLGNTADDGTYQVDGLSPGTHTLAVNVVIPGGCQGPRAFTWAGDAGGDGGCYTGPRFEANPQTFNVTATGTTIVDFIGIPFTEVTGWIWQDAMAPPAKSQVAVSVGGKACWPASLDHHTSAAGIPVTKFFANINSFVDPACAGGEVTISIDGRTSEFSVSWSSFWAGRLHQESVTFGDQWEETMIPLFTGAWGAVYATGDFENALPDLVPDGTIVRAYAGTTTCGQAETKTLRAEFRTSNLFGLAVLSDAMRAGCPPLRVAPSFCIGSVRANVEGYFPSVIEIPAAGVEAEVMLTPTRQACPLGPAGLPDTGGRR